MGDTFLHPFLKNICCNSPWNYAVFWKRQSQHESVLSWEDEFSNIEMPKIEDFYVDDSHEILLSAFGSSMSVAESSSTCHVIGKGLVGEVALTRKARWIYAGDLAADIFTSDTFSEYPYEWLLQFSAGIKTILLCPVDGYGVLQLGSVEIVAEDTTFLSGVEDVSDCFEESELPVWKYIVRELSLMFTFSESSEEPPIFFTENSFADQTALRPVNQLMTGYMVHNSHGTDSLENGTVCEIGDQVSGMSMIPMADPYQLSAEQSIFDVFHHEEMSTTSIFTDWEMHEGFLNELGDMDLQGCAFEQETGSTFFSFPEERELTVTGDEIHQFSLEDSEPVYGSVLHPAGYKVGSFGTGAPASDYSGFAAHDAAERKPLLKSAFANGSNSLDDTSSCKSSITSLNITEAKHLVSTIQRHEHLPVLNEDAWNPFAAQAVNSVSCLSPSVSSVDRKNSMLPDKQEQGKSDLSLKHEKVPRKRKDCCGDNQRARPRDRQLIQDRIKELRELVPNSEKCSIDGLLDKTIKHMLFLRNVTDQADKLKKHEADEKESRSNKINNRHRNGESWAVELGTDQQTCPIAVKDLDLPGHMLIETLCADHDRFLEIADVIHRLQLTVVKGVMDKSSDRSLARFIVETSGSFHRLDIFWPLMRLLQQNPMPVSSKMGF